MGQKRSRDEEQAQLLFVKRIEVVKSVKAQLANPSSVASQTVSAYSDLLEDLLKEVVLEVHRGVHTGQIDLEDTVTDQNILPAWVPQQKQTKSSRITDAFGQLVNHAGKKEVVCVCCGRSVASSRFAPHLENCLGMGRNGSRKARRKGDAPE